MNNKRGVIFTHIQGRESEEERHRDGGGAEQTETEEDTQGRPQTEQGKGYR